MNTAIIEDRQIRHRSDTRGIVVTRIQTLEINGQRFKASYWTNFRTGALHHIDSVPVQS